MAFDSLFKIKNFLAWFKQDAAKLLTFEQILNQISLPTFIMNQEGEVHYKNNACQAATQKFLHLKDLANFIKDDEKPKFAQFIEIYPKKNHLKTQFKGKENNRMIIVHCSKLEEESPAPAQWIVHFYPVEKSHALKNWVGPINDRFTVGIFEESHDAALVTNRTGTILAYNDKLKQFSPSKIHLNTSFLECLSKESATEFESAIELASSSQHSKKQIAIRFKDTEKLEISGFLKPLKNGLIFVHFLKASDQEVFQLQLLQSQKLHAMGELAGGIAHDFNNLLTAMIGFCDLLLMRHSPGDQSFTDIMQIKQNANRAANLVRQLLAFSRQQTLQPRKIDVCDNLAELKVLLQRLIGTSNELNIIHGRDLGFVRVDQGQLEQVIINLVVNARDAMPNGGTINIKTHTDDFSTPYQHSSGIVPKGAYVVIEISDTGTGINPEHLPRIFDPFFTTKEVGTGTGLGLSTVYGILAQMEGYILVDTELGKGTTFKIYLPQYQLEKDELLPQNQNEMINKDLTGNSVILLVEDEVAVRKFSARTLQEKGYEVIEAQNGREAYEYLVAANAKGEVIDLLVTDVVMPEMDGPELVAKAQELLPNLKVIFMSGYAESTFRHRLTKEKDIHFLPKPFNLKDLAMKVKDITGGKTRKLQASKPKNVISNYGRAT